MLKLGKYVPCQEAQEDIVVDEAIEPETVIVSRNAPYYFWRRPTYCSMS